MLFVIALSLCFQSNLLAKGLGHSKDPSECDASTTPQTDHSLNVDEKVTVAVGLQEQEQVADPGRERRMRDGVASAHGDYSPIPRPPDNSVALDSHMGEVCTVSTQV